MGGIFDPVSTPRVGSLEGEPKVSEAKQGMKRSLQIGNQKPTKSSGMGIGLIYSATSHSIGLRMAVFLDVTLPGEPLSFHHFERNDEIQILKYDGYIFRPKIFSRKHLYF